jgi:hypothetical protein
MEVTNETGTVVGELRVNASQVGEGQRDPHERFSNASADRSLSGSQMLPIEAFEDRLLTSRDIGEVTPP